MALSKRLLKAVEYVDSGLVVADIGCDHALLAIELIRTNKVDKVYAIDNRKAPLEGAKKNIIKYRVGESVITLLGDGMDNLPTDVKQVVIAGLGGSLIAKIIDNPNLKQIENLVIEANNDAIIVRKKLIEKGYKIVKEELLFEDGIIYEIMKAVKGSQKLDKEDCYFGPIIRKNINELFVKKYVERKEYLKSVVKKIPKQYDDRISAINDEIRMIEEELAKAGE